MRLEIRDVEDTTVYEIGPDGAVLGRERAKTDISLRDESVSKRHARIFPDDGAWLLEDLNSSNGTYIDEQRITGPVPITKGSVFALAQRKFEVVYVEGAKDSPLVPTGPNNGANGGLRSLHESGVPPLVGASSPPYASPRGSSLVAGDEIGNAAPFAAFPKAVAYYLVSVPLTLVNPVGAIRKASEERPVEPMGPMELAVFALPAGAVAFSIMAVAVAVGGGFSNAPLIGALVGSAFGSALAALIGFLLHPALEFVVALLKGKSDERSRTNCAVQFFTLLVIVALALGVGAFLATLSTPFVGLVGPILLTLVALMYLYFAYRWVVHFGLVSWVRYVVLALGCASVLATFASLVQRTRAQEGVSGASVAGEPGGAATEKVAAPPKPSPGTDKGRSAAVTPTRASRTTAVDSESKLKTKASPANPSRAQAAGAPTLRSSTRASVAESAARGKGARPIVTAEHPFGETPFVRFLAKRRAIERAVKDRPELLERRLVRRDYERLWRKTYSIREKYRKKRGERWKRDKILARQKDQEIFEATQKEVDRLYGRIFR